MKHAMKDSVRNSVKSAAHVVTSVPNNLLHTVDNAIGISRYSSILNNAKVSVTTP